MNYNSLFKEYGGFINPLIEIKINDVSFTAGANRKVAIGVSNVSIDLTAGFEASQAIFSLYNVYDYENTKFNFDSFKKMVLLGSAVTIYAGYEATVKEVFRGVITKVNFLIEEDDVPNVQVTAMDVKAVMMANRYSRRLKATAYSKAISEIFDQSVYQSLKNGGVITGFSIDNTPDALEPAPATEADIEKTIEMVGESDYEFVVKVAKKFNYDFFVYCGKVIFRKAKSDQTKQITINDNARIKRLSVDYDLTGLVEEVEVRGLDVGKAKGVT